MQQFRKRKKYKLKIDIISIMKRKNRAEKTEGEEMDDNDMDENDRIMFETAKKNEKSHKCGTYRQTKVFSD